MQVRVEHLAQRAERLDSRARASAAASSDRTSRTPFEQRVVLLRGLERAVEVVERGQQLLGEHGGAALLRAGSVARDTLAVVLEVGLRALREREVLVALRSDLHELVEVARELRPRRRPRRGAPAQRTTPPAPQRRGWSQPRLERRAPGR